VPFSCFDENTRGKNAVVGGFSIPESMNNGANIITPDVYLAYHVAVAYESSDVARWRPSSSSVKITPPATTRSTTNTAASTRPTANIPESTAPVIGGTKNVRSGLSTGAKAGIVSAAVIITAIVVVTCLLLFRRRGKKQEIIQPTTHEYFKAELSGEGIPHTELDGSAYVREADGFSVPPEADNSNVRAELEGASNARVELESDWTGWEAPASPKIALSRN
jgi:hypothetical protein